MRGRRAKKVRVVLPSPVQPVRRRRSPPRHPSAAGGGPRAVRRRKNAATPTISRAPRSSVCAATARFAACAGRGRAHPEAPRAKHPAEDQTRSEWTRPRVVTAPRSVRCRHRSWSRRRAAASPPISHRTAALRGDDAIRAVRRRRPTFRSRGPLDLRAEAAEPPAERNTNVAEDVLSAAKSVFHAVLPK